MILSPFLGYLIYTYTSRKPSAINHPQKSLIIYFMIEFTTNKFGPSGKLNDWYIYNNNIQWYTITLYPLVN